MTQHNLTQILKVIRDLVMRNRPCYRDYLGTETETKTMQIGAGTFVANDIDVRAEFPVTDSAFTGFVLGETYTVTIDGVTADYVARNLSPISDEVGPIISTTTTFDMGNRTFDGWLVACLNTPRGLICIAQTFDMSFVGKTISISQTRTETVKRYNTKLLPEYLLPTFLRKNVVASKTEVQSAADKANDAQTEASTALTRANNAQAAANTAKSTADEAKTKAANAYTKASIAETTAQNAVSFTTTQSLTDTEKKTARDNIGAGVPDGGTAGQLLSKTESGTAWVDPPQSGVQSDWNQNDDTQPDYVKNRPFYEDVAETVLLEESIVSFTNPDAGFYYAAIQTTIELTAGETYKVSWDGATYECVCESIMGYSVIGNPSIIGLGADTGDPFVITPLANDNGAEIYTKDTSASHTISISVFAGELVKIDTKYLPISTDGSYGVIKKSDIVSAYSFPARAPHDQMVDAINAFNTGNASIVWGGHNVINASYNSSDDTISVTFAIDPLTTVTFSNYNGSYVKTNGAETYGELQGIGVRIFNDNGVYTTLHTEGISGDTTLRVGAERIYAYGFELSSHALILASSTENSLKRFRITVDDSGTLTATEVTS